VWVGPPALALLTIGLALDRKEARIAGLLAAVCSLALVAAMVQSRSLCTLCLLVHIGVISMAVSLAPKAVYAAGALFSLATVFTATGAWDAYSVQKGIAAFRPTPGESLPEGKVLVLFTDPECPRCRELERQWEKRPPRETILRRWCLLPHSMYRTLREAALLETARIEAPNRFEALRRETARIQPPITDEALLNAARRAGLGSEAVKWLASPSERALAAIADDQTSARELGIESLPALAELSGSGPPETRTMHLVP
jgi:protein-disulfide isomerase